MVLSLSRGWSVSLSIYLCSIICHLDVLLDGEWIISWLHISSLDQDFLTIREARLVFRSDQKQWWTPTRASTSMFVFSLAIFRFAQIAGNILI
jgi:hypothetical protein